MATSPLHQPPAMVSCFGKSETTIYGFMSQVLNNLVLQLQDSLKQSLMDSIFQAR